MIYHETTSKMKTNELTTIVIVEDHEVHSLALAEYLEKNAPIKVLDRAKDISSAKEMLLKHKNADIVLLDLNLEEQTKYSEPEGLALAREFLARKDFLADFIVLTQHLEGRWIKRAFDMRIKGYLNKNCSIPELLQAIQDVQAGGLYYEGEIRKKMNEYWATTVFQSEEIRLTSREQQVLEYLGMGFKSTKIAEIMKIKPNTVETHRANLLRKFEAGNSAHLIQLAFRLGFLI